MREIQISPKPATIRYGCDYCKKTTAREATMERHEAMCYYNPDRMCPNPCCDGDGNQCYPADVHELCQACETWKQVQEELSIEDSIEHKKEFESGLVV